MIDLKEVSYMYKDIEVLRNINLKVGDGDRLVLLGINGSGKTTLLKILNALLFPQKGSYLYRGKEINEKNLRYGEFNKWFRKEVVLLFQNPDVMLFNPTVYDEIAFGPRQLGTDEKEIKEEVLFWSNRFGLSSYLERPPFELSGGEKQKLCLACLLVLKPRVLLLDEPTANLDPKAVGWFIDLLYEIDITSIISTHNLSLAPELGEKLVVLGENHTIVYQGRARDFLGDRERLMEAGLLHKHGQKDYHVHGFCNESISKKE
ncbi:MAG: energy-coupling factor ABC transporter ATP-binding protein [Aquificaceae bacterium]